nr:hypothetical protein [uncultured Cohaesibacter sp.]
MIDTVNDTMRDTLSDAIRAMDDIISLASDMVNLDNPHLWKDVWQRSQMAVSGKTIGI